MKRIEELAAKGAEWWSNILLDKLTFNLENIEDESIFEELQVEDFTNRSKVVTFEILLRNKIMEALKKKKIASLGCVDEPDSIIMSALGKSDLRDMKKVFPKNTSMLITLKKGVMLFINNEKKVLYP